MIVVPDAGPLIYLAGAGHLELLPALYSKVVVPRIVFDEIVVAWTFELDLRPLHEPW